MKVNELEMHIRVLGWLYILSNSILLLVGLTGLVFLTGIGLVSGDLDSVGVLGFIGGVYFLCRVSAAGDVSWLWTAKANFLGSGTGIGSRFPGPA